MLKTSHIVRNALLYFDRQSSGSERYNDIIAWIDKEKKLDLMIVIGTKGEVFPAGKFVDIAKEKGARVYGQHRRESSRNIDGKRQEGLGLRRQCSGDFTSAF
ncbi:hypothetical protein LSUB1_G002561 [Lachnellula subtilissima]|uniref:Uncharacterized protein n=1 Tax=Lachnellula subtilissima TaxID=602034 RepID=A0A8H8RQE6_9HELO|nr:hypothetical protein LSUB1_G002561 [Lachnellula subtilissima]